MSRIAIMWKSSPLQLLGALSALTLAALVAVGSGANFTAQSANPSNTFVAGSLTHSNSKDGAAILTATNLRPGDITTGTVDIANTGDIDGVFTLDKAVTASSALTGQLDLVVEDLGSPASAAAPGAGTVKYNGKLSAMGLQALGTFAPAVGHRYHFKVTFPDSGPNGADNAYKGLSTTVRFDWESTETS